MELSEEMEVVTKEVFLQAPAVDHHALDPELGCCPCCNCCSLPDCCSCPGCGSCPNCCCCCPSCCCPPSCACCCRFCCCLPRLLCKLPTFPSCPVHIKRLLIIVIIIVLIVVIIVGALLMGLHITQVHTEKVLQMTIQGLEGEESQLDLFMEMEEAATFYVDDGISDPATIVYDFNKLLIGYKPWHRNTCYIARMDKENVQGLEETFKEFQAKISITPSTVKEKATGFLTSLADRSILGTTVNILCSRVPVFWA